jgi:hypothetical protein
VKFKYFYKNILKIQVGSAKSSSLFVDWDCIHAISADGFIEPQPPIGKQKITESSALTGRHTRVVESATSRPVLRRRSGDYQVFLSPSIYTKTTSVGFRIRTDCLQGLIRTESRARRWISNWMLNYSECAKRWTDSRAVFMHLQSFFAPYVRAR